MLNYLLQILNLCLLLFHQCICSWGIVFDISFFCLWYVMLILAWIHLILSWFCDFGLNTLDSELVLSFCLEYTWFWVGFVILPWIHLILSWFCDFALNTLDSELVLCLHLIYQNAGYCFWYQVYCLWQYKKYHVSIWHFFSSEIHHKNMLCVAGCCCCNIAMKMQQKCVALCVSWHLPSWVKGLLCRSVLHGQSSCKVHTNS